jgi:hypothetical protein
MIAGDVQYASGAMRDRFLVAIDAGDWQECMRLALGLTTCVNPLPGLACRQLDLPARSTYGSAARRVLTLGRDALFLRPTGAAETTVPSGAEAAAVAPASPAAPVGREPADSGP